MFQDKLTHEPGDKKKYHSSRVLRGCICSYNNLLRYTQRRSINVGKKKIKQKNNKKITSKEEDDFYFNLLFTCVSMRVFVT